MPVLSRLGDHLNASREKPVEVQLLSGERTRFEGTLIAAQSDYIIVADGDAPEGHHLIPLSAIASIRFKKEA